MVVIYFWLTDKTGKKKATSEADAWPPLFFLTHQQSDVHNVDATGPQKSAWSGGHEEIG